VTARGELRCILFVLLAGACGGCLASTDYGLDEEPPRPESVTAPPATPQPACEPNASACVGTELLRCLGGRWQVEAECTDEGICSTALGRCTRCEPLVEHACNSGRLERCRADGDGFELLEDCVAVGKLCDVELSYDGCLGCRGTDRRCDDEALQRCVRGAFVDAGACQLGTCRVVDGRADYCPECRRPGQEGCGLGSRVLCTDALRFEQVESCPGGCAFDAGVAHCL
jgi:hypothetical protein